MAAFDPQRPFNRLPPLPPQAEVETRAVLKACIAARAALEGLRSRAALLNPTVLINTLPILEAQASSEIENIVTTTDALFRHLHDQAHATDPATKEALRYRTALFEGFQSLGRRPLSAGTAEQVCSTILRREMRVRRVPGTALTSHASGAIVYTPPEGEARLRELLANWEHYLHEARDTDPLIRMAVGHYQFEAIHPFTDGNGRTVRVLNLLFLTEQGLLDQPILYLSRAIIRRKADYYRLLLGVTTEQNWEDWIIYLLQAVTDTAAWTTDKIKAIHRLQALAAEHLRAAAPRLYSRELVEVIFQQPYCRIHNLVEAGIAQRQTASDYLKKLATLGLLEERKAGREKLFIHPAFLRLLTAENHDIQPYGEKKRPHSQQSAKPRTS
jgi:Fic family protein